MKCPNCKSKQIYEYILAKQKCNCKNVYDYKLIAVGRLRKYFCEKCEYGWEDNETVEETCCSEQCKNCR